MDSNVTPTLRGTGARRLNPDAIRLWIGDHGSLHCTVDDQQYAGVFAVRLSPIRHPDHFVSLCHTDDEDRVREIGVIDDPAELEPAAKQLVDKSLGRHYHEQTVERIHRVRLEHGLLFIDATTGRGREEFVLPWRHDRAEEYDEHGKVLLDALDNRFVIPDLRTLPEKDRVELTRFIYW